MDIWDITHACSLSGHRPQKLLFPKEAVVAYLRQEINMAYNDGYTVFISGMADGVDIWAADIVLEFKLIHKEVRLVCALPYPYSSKQFDKERILTAADKVYMISKNYAPSCFKKRNEWMVDHSSRLIAVCNDLHSGTANTVAYAKSMGIDIRKLTQ